MVKKIFKHSIPLRLMLSKKKSFFSKSSIFRKVFTLFLGKPGTMISACFVFLLILVALMAPFLAPHNPVEQFRDAVRVPPFWQDAGNVLFPLGTDEAGRDILSRLIYGARLSIMIGFVSVVLAMIPGISLGILAAFYARWLDMPIMRFMDVLLALPALLLAVAIVAILGPGLINTMLAIAIVGLPSYTRLARVAAKTELQKDYVMASYIAGASNMRIIFVHVLPNCAASLIVQATLGVSGAILDAAALGFLGLGVQSPDAEWGTMLASARDYMVGAWWIVAMPGIAILITVLAINLLGDGLRDALDPRLKRVQ